MRYAFVFDASSCTGCKACQVACKDKNELPTGILWRRVYEVSGGSWQPRGQAWTNTVFAYNVSVGCNHCENPACVEACPTGAYVIREDGIVCQEPERCIGCRYCVWACPYGAPQYSSHLGRTTKCDLCIDLIDEGLPPACVAACPMRALDLAETPREAKEPRRAETPRAAEALGRAETLGRADARRALPFPFPSVAGIRPNIEVEPHPAMWNGLRKAVANYEEVRGTGARYQVPGTRKDTERAEGFGSGGELPLVFFTLLAQAAAGAAVLSLLAGTMPRASLAIIGVLLIAAALVSALHLGTARGAWRAAANLRRSRLSREIGWLLLFGAAWLVALVAPRAGLIAMAACGAALVVGMAAVYRLEAVPPWNTWRTPLSFAATSLLLGALIVIAASNAAGSRAPDWMWFLAWALLGVQGWLVSAAPDGVSDPWRRTRSMLILVSMAVLALLPVTGPAMRQVLFAIAATAILVEEAGGRLAFYAATREKMM